MIFSDTKSILKYIKSIMVMNEIQSKELANFLHISESTLSARFKQDNISINVLIEILDALGLAMDISFIEKKNISNRVVEPNLSSYQIELKKLQNKSGTDS